MTAVGATWRGKTPAVAKPCGTPGPIPTVAAFSAPEAVLAAPDYWKIGNGRQGQPKWLIGFSDITSLLWSLVGQGIAGVHGPLLTTLKDEPDWSQQRLFDCVEGRSLPPLIGQSWRGGTATGMLLPANLTVATHLLGTPHEPPLAGTILALEDVTEAPYRLDRMLTHWRMAGKLQQVAGIAIGRFSRCDPTNTAPSFTAMEVLQERLGDLGIPIVADLPFGHDGENAALPVGVMATLDGDGGGDGPSGSVSDHRGSLAIG
jgi:muramoyltetrapeptide carboxypeptidase